MLNNRLRCIVSVAHTKHEFTPPATIMNADPIHHRSIAFKPLQLIVVYDILIGIVL